MGPQGRGWEGNVGPQEAAESKRRVGGERGAQVRPLRRSPRLRGFEFVLRGFEAGLRGFEAGLRGLGYIYEDLGGEGVRVRGFGLGGR